MDEIKNILAGLMAITFVILVIPLSPLLFLWWIGKSFREEVLCDVKFFRSDNNG